MYELNWGDNPPGFKDWIVDKMEKDFDRKQKLKRWLLIVPVLIIVGLIVWLLLRH